MIKTMVLYDSRYGTTEQVAKYLALILGPSKCSRIGDFQPSYRDFDCLVIGSPIYKGLVLPSVWNFLRDNSWLRSKPVALFCTCLEPEDGEKGLAQLRGLQGKNLLATEVFGGRLDLERLEEGDRADIQFFFKRTGHTVADMNTLDLDKVMDFGLEILKRTESPGDMPKEHLKSQVEAFLIAHNTCTLATASRNRVRATPIEYAYRNGCMYMLTEGGRKFANLIVNPEVSLAVYDEYESMATIAGMQISGTASMVGPEDQEFGDVLRMKGLRPSRLAALPIALTVIKVKLKRVEFLNAKFKAKGYGISQIFTFED